jgi:hypothetical protein
MGVPVPAGEIDDLGRPDLFPSTISVQADPLEEAIVRVVGAVSCTGTVIAPDLVLTAHHCVSDRDEAGHVLERDMEAKKVKVELGGDDLPWATVGVKAIVSPACGYVRGDGDIAILVLTRELVGWPTLTARLHEPPRVDEPVTPLGFGRCAHTGGPIRRHVRDGGPILAVGGGVFKGEASICPGDSGGPVLDQKREIVGVVSAAIMDTDAKTRDPAYFARIDKFSSLFENAREIANGVEPNALPPYRSCGR